MRANASTSHNRRDVELCKPKVRLCGFCWEQPARTSQQHCSDDCRFWSKVRKGPACWEWVGGLHTEGYGQFSADVNGRRRPIGAHVFSWQLAHGLIPDGKFILHHCDNRKCVRPDHLFLGDHKANMEDAAMKGRLHAPRPTAHKVTPEQIAAIRQRVAAGERQNAVAADFGISKVLVSLIVRGLRRQYDAPLSADREAVA